MAIPLAIALKYTPQYPIPPSQKLPLLLSLYLLAPPLLGWMATQQGQTLSDYGVLWSGASLRSLLLGLTIAGVGVVGLDRGQQRLGWTTKSPQVAPPLHWGQVLSILAIALGVGWVEELVFRGFLVTQLQVDYAPWLAATIASLIFALLHLVWEGRETLPQLPGLWLMGMVLVLARSVDQGNLALAWGLHSGWIWAIATLDTTQAIVYTGRAPVWVTGFNNKPLAGAMGLLLLGMTAIGLQAL